MIVKWNPPRLKVVPIINKAGGLVGSKVFVTGYNDVPDKEWNDLKAHLKDTIERGDMVVISEDDPVGKSKEAKSIPFIELEEDKKLRIIGETIDVKSLESWLKEETKDTVRVYLKNRIDQMKVYLKTGKKPGDDE